MLYPISWGSAVVSGPHRLIAISTMRLQMT